VRGCTHIETFVSLSVDDPDSVHVLGFEKENLQICM
jgi:hypothetical protein